MAAIYIYDPVNKNVWALGVSVQGALSSRNLGGGFALPPLFFLNDALGTTANSYQLGISPTGVPSITLVSYSASNPTFLQMLDATFRVWDFQVVASGGPRFVLSIIPLSPTPPNPLPSPSPPPGLGAGLYASLPMIVYPSAVTGLQPASTSPLFFRRPPRFVPYFVLEGVRHDNRASSGVQEVIWERTDSFFEGEMEYVALDSRDVIDWQTFLKVAVQGVPFDYSPSPFLSPNFTTFYMDDKNVSAAYKDPNLYTFKLRWYQYVPWS